MSHHSSGFLIVFMNGNFVDISVIGYSHVGVCCLQYIPSSPTFSSQLSFMHCVSFTSPFLFRVCFCISIGVFCFLLFRSILVRVFFCVLFFFVVYTSCILNGVLSFHSSCFPAFHCFTGRMYPVTLLNTSQGSLHVVILYWQFYPFVCVVFRFLSDCVSSSCCSWSVCSFVRSLCWCYFFFLVCWFACF